MSEYQYYEFRAIDRPLSADDMASLRSLSSRAEISPRRLAVTYNYGDFRGDPIKLMHKHFDLMVYLSNFGTSQLLLRLPEGALTPAQIKPYLAEDSLILHRQKESLVLEFLLNLEGAGGWVEENEGPDAVEALLPVREMLLRGDLAPLYVGWLGSLAFSLNDAPHDDQDGEEDEDDDEDESGDDEGEGGGHEGVEPPVPAGLSNLAPALTSLAEFLAIPDSLLQAAAEASPDKAHDEPSEKEFSRWLSKVSSRQQASWLTRLAFAQEAGVGAEVMRQFRASLTKAPKAAKGRRSAAQLIQKANEIEQARRQQALEAKKRKKEARDKEKQKQREAIAADPAKAWEQVDQLVLTKEASNYDRAVEILVLLREIAKQAGEMDEFKRLLKGVRQRHVSKSAFHRKLYEQKLYARGR